MVKGSSASARNRLQTLPTFRPERTGLLQGKVSSWYRRTLYCSLTDVLCCVAGLSEEELAEEEEAEVVALQRQMAEELVEDAYAAPEKVVRCAAILCLRGWVTEERFMRCMHYLSVFVCMFICINMVCTDGVFCM